MKRLLICLFLVFGLVGVGHGEVFMMEDMPYGSWSHRSDGLWEFTPRDCIVWDATNQPEVLDYANLTITAEKSDDCCCCECCVKETMQIKVGDWVRFSDDSVTNAVGIVIGVKKTISLLGFKGPVVYVGFPSKQQGIGITGTLLFNPRSAEMKKRGLKYYWPVYVNMDNESVELIMKGK